MWNLNIGRVFESQMKERISDHPEILHKWNKGENWVINIAPSANTQSFFVTCKALPTGKP